jgi:hypothetical protein
MLNIAHKIDNLITTNSYLNNNVLFKNLLKKSFGRKEIL